MTTIDAPLPAAIPAAPAPPAAAAPRSARFVGQSGDFWALILRGAPLLLITLGIYRFWLTTDIRRFLWSNSEVAGEPLEYVGTPRELLLGFLFAVAVLIPLYVALFAGSLWPGLGLLGQLSGIIVFPLFWVLGQYAVYRARRYRLTRTVLRGLRFNQTGSAWRYALYATLWSVLTLVTFGLAYPFAQAQLERFKLRNTHFGDLTGRFEGSGLRLFLRGFVMWLLVVGPPLAAFAVTLARIDWSRLAEIGELPDLDDDDGAPEIVQILLTAFPDIKTIALVFGVALLCSMLAALFLYPVFRAMVLRWWASGVRFGDITATSRLRTAAVYGTYAKFVGLSFALSIGASALFGAVAGFVSVTVDVQAKPGQIVAAAVAVVGYAALMLGCSALHQGVVQLSLWRLAVDSLDIAGTSVLDRVTAQGEPSSSFGEGLADALNVGGL